MADFGAVRLPELHQAAPAARFRGLRRAARPAVPLAVAGWLALAVVGAEGSTVAGAGARRVGALGRGGSRPALHAKPGAPADRRPCHRRVRGGARLPARVGDRGPVGGRTAGGARQRQSHRPRRRGGGARHGPRIRGVQRAGCEPRACVERRAGRQCADAPADGGGHPARAHGPQSHGRAPRAARLRGVLADGAGARDGTRGRHDAPGAAGVVGRRHGPLAGRRGDGGDARGRRRRAGPADGDHPRGRRVDGLERHHPESAERRVALGVGHMAAVHRGLVVGWTGGKPRARLELPHPHGLGARRLAALVRRRPGACQGRDRRGR